MCQSQPPNSIPPPCSLVSIRLISTCLLWFFFPIIFQSTMQSEQESPVNSGLPLLPDHGCPLHRVWAQGKQGKQQLRGPRWTSSALRTERKFWACVNLRGQLFPPGTLRSWPSLLPLEYMESWITIRAAGKMFFVKRAGQYFFFLFVCLIQILIMTPHSAKRHKIGHVIEWSLKYVPIIHYLGTSQSRYKTNWFCLYCKWFSLWWCLSHGISKCLCNLDLCTEWQMLDCQRYLTSWDKSNEVVGWNNKQGYHYYKARHFHEGT